MNDYRTVPRAATGLIARAANVNPVVVVLGARQTGKSTLVRDLVPLGDRPYLTLDDLSVRMEAQESPATLVNRAPKLTLDEVQRSPDLLLEVKRAVDQDRPRVPGRFLLTGSANLLLMQRVSESLAGRATYITLWPLVRREQLGEGRVGLWSELFATPVEGWYDLIRASSAPTEDWRAFALRGGYPVPALQLDDSARTLWFEGYIQTYLERDLQTLSTIENLADFRRLMEAAALRVGGIVNQADLARDVELSRPTAHRYLNLLEVSYQLIRLPAYSVNRTRRLIKSPRLFWSDVGLACALARVEEPTGMHLENLVLLDLLTWRDTQIRRPEILYWRTTEGHEVDFVIEHARQLLPIEVKANSSPTHRDTRHLRLFRDEYGRAVRGGLLLHTGDDVYWAAEGVLAAPWWRVL